MKAYIGQAIRLVKENTLISISVYVGIAIIFITFSSFLKSLPPYAFWGIASVIMFPVLALCLSIFLIPAYEMIISLKDDMSPTKGINSKLIILIKNFWGICFCLIWLSVPFIGILAAQFQEYSTIIAKVVLFSFLGIVCLGIYIAICLEFYKYLYKVENDKKRIFLSYFLPVAIPCAIISFFYILGEKNTNIVFYYIALAIEYGFYAFLAIAAVVIALSLLALAIGALIFALKVVCAILSEGGCILILAIIGLITVIQYIF